MMIGLAAWSAHLLKIAKRYDPKTHAAESASKSSGGSKNTMTVPRLLKIVVIAGALATAANANDQVLPPAQPAASAGLFEGIDTIQPDASGGDSGSQPPPGLDRRDRIFYPGDTERPKPLLRKLFLNIVL